MFKLEKRHWVFIGLVGLLFTTAFINYTFNTQSGDINQIALKPTPTPQLEESQSPSTGGTDGSETQEGGDDVTTNASSTYFTNFRAERTANREKEIGYLDAIISDKNSDQDTISDAQDQKLALVAAMEKEVTIEGLVKAKGFKDCVVTIQKGTVNVVVDNDEELTQEQAAQILEIARRESGEDVENIKILPKN